MVYCIAILMSAEKPTSCGKINHIQWVRLCFSVSSSTTCPYMEA